MLRQDGAASLDPGVADQEVEIIPERFGEFGLAVEQVHDPQVRRQASQLRIENPAWNAAARRLRP